MQALPGASLELEFRTLPRPPYFEAPAHFHRRQPADESLADLVVGSDRTGPILLIVIVILPIEDGPLRALSLLPARWLQWWADLFHLLTERLLENAVQGQVRLQVAGAAEGAERAVENPAVKAGDPPFYLVPIFCDKLVQGVLLRSAMSWETSTMIRKIWGTPVCRKQPDRGSYFAPGWGGSPRRCRLPAWPGGRTVQARAFQPEPFPPRRGVGSERPAAVKGAAAPRRSESLTARTVLKSSSQRERLRSDPGQFWLRLRRAVKKSRLAA